MKTQSTERRLNVRMSLREYAALQVRAARCGQTISNYVRELIRRDSINPIQADGQVTVTVENME